MKIAYYGHPSFAAEINGKRLLFDRFITQNPLAKAVDIKKSRPTISSCLTHISTTSPTKRVPPWFPI
jgi:L-ascorbate metabolism protein UlaG (beta-lactamase superfamily)